MAHAADVGARPRRPRPRGSPRNAATDRRRAGRVSRAGRSHRPHPPGPLPAYASDLRPVVSAAPRPRQPAAHHGDAGLGAGAPVGRAKQPESSRGRASSTPPNAPPPPSSCYRDCRGHRNRSRSRRGIGERHRAGASATPGGRVARQQPRLAWAAGRSRRQSHRPDHRSGQRLDPTRHRPARRSDTAAPGTTAQRPGSAAWPSRRRGRLLPDPPPSRRGRAGAHVPRPRRAPDIDDLGWQLSQATQWRDGLPRLAHTLAKAASGGTGVLDSEVELLHEHLTTSALACSTPIPTAWIPPTSATGSCSPPSTR